MLLHRCLQIPPSVAKSTDTPTETDLDARPIKSPVGNSLAVLFGAQEDLFTVSCHE